MELYNSRRKRRQALRFRETDFDKVTQTWGAAGLRCRQVRRSLGKRGTAVPGGRLCRGLMTTLDTRTRQRNARVCKRAPTRTHTHAHTHAVWPTASRGSRAAGEAPLHQELPSHTRNLSSQDLNLFPYKFIPSNLFILWMGSPKSEQQGEHWCFSFLGYFFMCLHTTRTAT